MIPDLKSPTMLGSHIQNGIDAARQVWSRIPTSEDGVEEELLFSTDRNGGGPESLDYEVIENYAYREEQVCS